MILVSDRGPSRQAGPTGPVGLRRGRSPFTPSRGGVEHVHGLYFNAIPRSCLKKAGIEDYNATLETLGKTEGITLATDPDAAANTHMNDLDKLSGTSFDTLYIQDAIRIDDEDKKDAKKEQSETQSPAIRGFLAKFADMDAEHEKLARQLENSKG